MSHATPVSREELTKLGLGRMKTIPYRYQLDGPARLKKFNYRGILADTMGLGKSVQALICRALIKTTGPMVVVCPASVKGVWQRECEKHLGWRAIILEGRTPPKDVAFLKGERIFLANYDILGLKNPDPKAKKPQSWNDFLSKLYPALVVFDEGHYLINLEAKRTKAAIQLVEDVPHTLILTGTPVTSKPKNLFALCKIVRPEVFPSFWKFVQRYCAPKLTPFGWDYSGASNLRELNQILTSKLMVRRTTEEVHTQMPKLNRVQVPVTLGKEAWKEYQAAETEFIQWLRRTAGAGKANRARNAERLVKAGYLKRLAAQLKIPAAKAWIDEYLEGGGKLLVFGIGRETVVDAVHRLYADKAVKVTGLVKNRLRDAAFEAFNKNPDVKLLFGNMMAAGTGWSCTATSISLMLEMDWNPGTMAQAEKRTHGVGRGIEGLPSFAYYLIAKGTIDERLMDIWASKQNVIDQVIDGKDEVENAGAVLDMLEASYTTAKPVPLEDFD